MSFFRSVKAIHRFLRKFIFAAVWTGGVESSAARPTIVGWDDSLVFVRQSVGMSFDRTPGNLEVTDAGFHALLSDECPLTGNFSIQPAIDFRSTILRFNDVPNSIPVSKNNLQSFGVYPSTFELSALACWSSTDSPWTFGTWSRSGLATDFRDVDRDDLTLDLAAGGAFKVRENLTVGLGIGAFNLLDDKDLLPGVGFDWEVSRRLRISLCGENWAATWSDGGNWRFGFRGESGSEIWNIRDDAGKSRYIDYRTYRIGLFANRLLGHGIYFSAGAGLTVSNEMGLTRRDGTTLLRQGLDSGLYGELGITVVSW